MAEVLMLIFIGFYLNWKLGLALIGIFVIDMRMKVRVFNRLKEDHDKNMTKKEKS